MFNSNSIKVYRLADGTPPALASGIAPPSIDVVLAGNFTGMAPTPTALGELLMYDAGAGSMSVYRVAPGATLQLVKSHSVSKRWDLLVAGNFKGGTAAVAQEVLLYDRTEGMSKFIRFSPEGELVTLSQQDWTDKWDVIVAGHFGASIGEDLLFYDQRSGRVKVWEVVDGQLTQKWIDTTVEPGCTVVAGRFRTGISTDSVFFYQPRTGTGWLFTIGSGTLTLRRVYHDLHESREVLVPGRLTAGNLHQLLFYDRDSGIADVFAFVEPDAALQREIRAQLAPHAQAVVPCNFLKTAPVDLDEIILYGIHNRVVGLGWGAHVDTPLPFSAFFDSNHTVTCWFMPQFVHASYQPVVAENGSGHYAFGLGDYGDSNLVYNKDSGTEFNQAGDPLLFVRVGQEKRIYTAPGVAAGSWVHLALIRRNNHFMLYLDGVHQTPVTIETVKATVKDDDGKDVEVVRKRQRKRDTELEVTGINFDGKPSGTLRIGRRTSGTDDKGLWQTYGLVDEVAVFSTALSAADLATMVAARRLRGDEAGLLACWPFDVPGSDAGGVFRTWTLSSRPGATSPLPIPALVSASAGRSSDNDRRLFSDPGVLNRCHVLLHLPFKPGEKWQVGQGMDSALGSHHGASAFCYDFNLSAGGAETANVPVVACVTGQVVAYRKGDKSGPRESNTVRLQFAVDRAASYLHLAKNSLNEAIVGGTLDPSGDPADPEDDLFLIEQNVAPTLQRGALVGKVGPLAKHLHFGTRASNGAYDEQRCRTIPTAFRDFERLDPGTNTWKAVEAGFLLDGDVFRKPR